MRLKIGSVVDVNAVTRFLRTGTFLYWSVFV